MEDHTLQDDQVVLEAAIATANCVLDRVPKNELLPLPKAIVGLTLHAKNLADGVLWAYRHGNRSVAMTCFRVIAEAIIDLDFILAEEKYSHYFACLLLLEGPRRSLRIQNSKHFPTNLDQNAARQARELLTKYSDAILATMDSLPKPERAPTRWTSYFDEPKSGTSIWKRAQDSDWAALYDLAYEAASGYVHADGLAIDELLTGSQDAWDLVVHYSGMLLLAHVHEVLKQFPAVELYPDVRALWGQFTTQAEPQGTVD